MKHIEFHLSVLLLLILESNSMFHKRYFKVVGWPWLDRSSLDRSPFRNIPISEEVGYYYDSEMDDDPETRPGLIEGDIAMPVVPNELQNNWRVSWRKDKYPEKLWPNGTVPYIISPLYGIEEYITIYTAIRTINYMTCVKFVPWNGKAKDFLVIWPAKRPKGCWSYVGRQGGPQALGLQPPDAVSAHCLEGEGRAIHELMHALGIFHEQSRSDRDLFVDIHYENIIPEYKSNFEKQSLKNTNYSFEYDYDSIMHYGKYYFSKEKGKPTITAKLAGAKKMGQRKGMSVTDCLKINKLYGCLDRNIFLQRKYYHICMSLGL